MCSAATSRNTSLAAKRVPFGGSAFAFALNDIAAWEFALSFYRHQYIDTFAVMAQQYTEQKALKERDKYVSSFNATMVKIWQEQIILLGVIDTGQLLESTIGIRCDRDERIVNISLGLSFLEYGLWQNYGTGREVPRGNLGDIGRDKVRQKRPWFSKKFYASFMNLKEFLADSLGREFLGIVSDALDSDKMRRNSAHYNNSAVIF